MQTTCHIALLFLLILSFYQDWKFRAISWMVFPALLACAATLFWLDDRRGETWLFNIVFLAVVFGSLFIYISFKRQRWVNLFKSDLGLGDVLFLIAISPLFSDRNFILFFISGMMLSGLIHWFVRFRDKDPKIPLAGYLALYVVGLKGVSFLIQNDLFYNPLF